MKNKIVATLLSVSLVFFSMLSVSAQDINTSESGTRIKDGFEYEFAYGYPIIYGYYGENENAVMPVLSTDDPIIVVDGAFRYNTRFTSMVVAEGVLNIGEETFYNCTNLEKVVLPESLEYISVNAFAGCWNLKEVNIPDNIKEIRSNSFDGCNSLKTITIGKNTNLLFDQSVFPNYKSIETVTLLDSVTEIYGTFNNCTGLKQVNIPNSVTAIGSGAFENCRNLKSIELPDSVTSIGLTAFQGCTNLESIVIPKNVEYIDWTAFNNCYKLTIYGYTDSYAEKYAKLYDIPFISLNETNILIGDVNNDKEVNIVDATEVQTFVAKYDTGNVNFDGADVDQDGEITIQDATWIQMYVAKLIDDFNTL